MLKVFAQIRLWILGLRRPSLVISALIITPPALANLGKTSALSDFASTIGVLANQGKNVVNAAFKEKAENKSFYLRALPSGVSSPPFAVAFRGAIARAKDIELRHRPKKLPSPLFSATGINLGPGSVELRSTHKATGFFRAPKGGGTLSPSIPVQTTSATKISGAKDTSSSSAFLKGKIDYKVVDPSDTRLNSNYLGLIIPGQQWELNQVKQMKFDLGTANDVIKLSIRESENAYQADPSFLLNAAGSGFGKLLFTNKLTGKSRFLTAQTPISLSGSERLELNLLRDSLFSLSVFGMHAKTGNLFQANPQLNIQQNDGVAANQEMTGAGARAALGPVSLILKSKRTTAVVGTNSPWQISLEKSISLDVADAVSRVGAPYALIEHSILPSSIYASLSDSAQVSAAISNNAFVAAPTTKSRSIGATWGGSNASADVSYYDYFLNSHLTGDANFDYGGKGISASISAWTDRFLITGSASCSENNSMSPNFEDRSRSLSVYASSTIHLDNFPDIFMEFTGFGSDYHAPAYDTKYRSSAMSSAFGLDLTKYLIPIFRAGDSVVAIPSTINFRSASLKTFYRYQDGFDFIVPGQMSKSGHFLGLSFRAALN